MGKTLASVCGAVLVLMSSVGCAWHQAQQARRLSGIDTTSIDNNVRVQDDLYQHANGKWLANLKMPADEAYYDTFTQLNDDVQQKTRELIEAAANSTSNAFGSNEQKIGDLYASFMNETRLDTLAAKPLEPEFTRIQKLEHGDNMARELARLCAHNSQIGVVAPLDFAVQPDARDSSHYIAVFGQSGLGLPDRDYYLKADDAKLSANKKQYEAHITKMLGLLGDSDTIAGNAAHEIVEFETQLARLQWTQVENRDQIKTYNKVTVADLQGYAPDFDWADYFEESGLAGKSDSIIIRQPSYFQGFGKLLNKTPAATLQAYFRWHLLHSYAANLSKPYLDEHFAFYKTALSGIPQRRPRWKSGVRLVDASLGEILGQLYFTKFFPPENKERMLELVNNVIAAYRQRITTLDWMSDSSRKEALAKLDKLTLKVGYPDKWRDYSALTIDRDDLVGNVRRATEFEYHRNLDKLGKPVDRKEWFMTPQTVNAYYNPGMNEIVFPAAILQPPFFSMNADDAVNYGRIGQIIGHEISHGFDDEGSRFDSDGNLRDWLTPEDHVKFKTKTAALVAQANAYSPIPGYNVNGELTLGENIADNSGLAIAYLAYHLSLNNKPAPVIDDRTGDQRFFLSWAQVFRGKRRDAETIRLIKIDPHMPIQLRANAAAVNQDAFFDAFDIKPGDRMYLPPDRRVQIW